jgi:hypothetical protein
MHPVGPELGFKSTQTTVALSIAVALVARYFVFDFTLL